MTQDQRIERLERVMCLLLQSLRGETVLEWDYRGLSKILATDDGVHVEPVEPPKR